MFFHARAGKHGFSAAVQLEHGGRRTREVNPGTGTGNRDQLYFPNNRLDSVKY